MIKLKKIKTNETISELFNKLKISSKFSFARIYYYKKKIGDNNIEYGSADYQFICFSERDKYIAIMEEITNRKNFLFWCDYSDMSKYWKKYNFKNIDIGFNIIPYKNILESNQSFPGK